ncbi:helix-turn-helix domain-containing protein [Sphingobacterium sp. HJSM2_6]|uniref:helix-turn-helix domain-containing protein n=1 Tax=Sphingobacterium sp. HJSM2_6 TaxID=3366264 RepID=UPI003BD7BCEB
MLLSSKLLVKNMVCDRCIRVVQQELNSLGIKVLEVKLGEVNIAGLLDEVQLHQINQKFEELGFELLKDKKEKIVEKIKNILVNLIHHDQQELKTNISQILQEIIGLDYGYISQLFSEQEGQTIEKYVIQQRVEKAKELLRYNELTLNEIAQNLHYSSVAHLSAQFKKITGMTPSQYKANEENHRISLDKV